MRSVISKTVSCHRNAVNINIRHVVIYVKDKVASGFAA